jgi:serine/threonine protein kinase
VPAPSSVNADAKRESLDTLAATWLAESQAAERPRPGPSDAIQEDTVALSQPGVAEPAGRRPIETTIAETREDAGTGGKIEPPSELDRDADFLSAVAKVPAGQAPLPEEIPTTLGGYKVLKELGRGGMGAVYLARQLSLGRDVALKVMASRWARDPTHLARFTREAYAAAQLVHHNIVQIYDFGADQGVNYFSMEYVDGQTLAELVRTTGVVPPEVAVSHILQASRGLKIAHDHGMIHRDIKPENLMVNRHGIVKLADLGLVKVTGDGEPGAPVAVGGTPPAGTRQDERDEMDSAPNVTRLHAAMGTASYMAPEQAKDAANVSRAADIYSLGCTLYALVTGRPPFQGKTALEVITKHAVEPVVAPDVIVAQVPQALSSIILKMVAKKPEERYQTIDEVIAALEGFLSIERSAPLAPRPDEAELLENCVQALDSSPATRLRKRFFLGFIITVSAGALVALLAGWPVLAGLLIALGVLTPLAYAIREGVARATPLYAKIRQFVLESGPSERIALAAGLVLLVSALAITKWFWICVILVVLATALSSLASRLINRNLDQEHREPIERIQNVLKTMRLRGLDEETLRRFLAERCGPRWDTLRDSLFGYEGHLIALEQWGRAGWERARPKLALWRDAALAWIEAQLQARRDSRARRYLQQVEEQSLKAQGMGFFEARGQARRVADALVAQARELHAATLKGSRAVMESLASDESRQRIFQKLRAAAERPDQVIDSMERGLLARRSAESLESLIGPRARFLASLVLLLGFVIWMYQNSMATPDISPEPLWLPLVPSLVTGVIRDANSAVAALILMASALVPGWRISLTIIPAAAIALLGTTLGLPAWLSLAAALALAGLGFFLARAAPPSPQAADGHDL